MGNEPFMDIYGHREREWMVGAKRVGFPDGFFFTSFGSSRNVEEMYDRIKRRLQNDRKFREKWKDYCFYVCCSSEYFMVQQDGNLIHNNKLEEEPLRVYSFG